MKISSPLVKIHIAGILLSLFCSCSNISGTYRLNTRACAGGVYKQASKVWIKVLADSTFKINTRSSTPDFNGKVWKHENDSGKLVAVNDSLILRSKLYNDKLFIIENRFILSQAQIESRNWSKNKRRVIRKRFYFIK